MLRGTASLAHCKEKFGAEPVDYPELRLERLPYTHADQAVRSVVKRALWFRDVQPFARVQGVAPLDDNCRATEARRFTRGRRTLVLVPLNATFDDAQLDPAVWNLLTKRSDRRS